MSQVQKAIGAIVLFVAVVLFGAVTSGWALSVLWGWFVMPTFHQRSLSIGAAIGISLVLRYAINTAPPKAEKEPWELLLAKGVGVATLTPLLTVGFGWIIHMTVAA